LTEAKIWTTEEIKALLAESDKAVARAILAIYNRQTEDEKIVKETSASNGVGYNGVDANFMSSLAQFYQAKGFLSAGQLKYGRKAIMKYAGQLTEIANA
jgi:phosphoribulokinase